MIKYIKRLVVLFIALYIIAPVGYLLFWPVGVDIKAWKLAPMPKAEGVMAPNDLLSKAEAFGPVLPGVGPESIVFDKDGNLYTAVSNGKIVKVSSDGKTMEVFADVAGRPTGMDFDKDGNLYVVNMAKGGLQLVTKDKQVKMVVKEAGGKPLERANAVTIADDGMIYLTDSSTKQKDRLLAQITDPSGRVISYNPKTGEIKEIAKDIRIPNGITISHDQSFLLINEAMTSKVLKYNLTGPKAGVMETFAESVGGYNDNIFRGMNGLYWIGIHRDAEWLKTRAESPFVNNVSVRLDKASKVPFINTIYFSAPGKLLNYLNETKSSAVAIDGQGKIIRYLAQKGHVLPEFSTAYEKDGWVYLVGPALTPRNNQIYRVKL